MKGIKGFFHNSLNGDRKPRVLFLQFLLIFVVVSILLMRYTWVANMNQTAAQALKMAEIAGAALNGEMIRELKGEPGDESSIAYKSIKSRLMKLETLEDGIYFAYLYTERNGKLYIIADSKPAGSADYSPPGQQLTEGTADYKKPFISGKSLITPPVTDRWGTWMSILVPLKDDNTGKIIAVFGMDYPAKAWDNNAIYRTVQAGIILCVLFLLLHAFYRVANKNYLLKEANQIIRRSEEKFFKAFHSNSALMAIMSVEDGAYIDVNETFLETLGFARNEIIGKKDVDLNIFVDLDSKRREELRAGFVKDSKSHNYEIRAKAKNSAIHYFLLSMDGITLGVKPCRIVMMVDITERKRAEEEILYLSYHDQLTGLYNRRFYQEEMIRLDVARNLPLTIAMGDVNGLKLINDSFGHAAGNELLQKAANVMKKSCRVDDIIARLGGDEFVILLPRTDAAHAQKIIERIQCLAAEEKVESIDVSISFGYETKYKEEESFEAVLKQAEEYMYRKKLFQSQSMQGQTIGVIISTLYQKNKREETHSHKVAALCEKMGIALGLPETVIMELKTAGLFHDIGKIAIDPDILNNNGDLTNAQWKEISRHPEIGYRILSTTNDTSEMAGWVLAHHERWDGTGYPKGLKGEEIPLMARIISIVDSYDAMTSGSRGQSVLSEDAAREAIKANAGIKFDPELVSIFIEKVIGKKS